MSQREPNSHFQRPDPIRVAVAGGRIVMALLLGGGGLLFLLHGRGHFERLGLPDHGRIGLATAEIMAAVLFAIRRTAPLGAIALLLVLAWAAGLHFAIREPSGGLYVYMAIVAVLAHAEDLAAAARREKSGTVV
jgi:hypothetical protein